LRRLTDCFDFSPNCGANDGRCPLRRPDLQRLLQPAAPQPQLHAAPEQEPGQPQCALDTGHAGAAAAARYVLEHGLAHGVQGLAAEDRLADAPGPGDVPARDGRSQRGDQRRQEEGRGGAAAVAEFELYGDREYDDDAKEKRQEEE
jgi:hypothetical protein